MGASTVGQLIISRFSISKTRDTTDAFQGMCVCAECRQSRLAAAQLAAQSPLLGWRAACTAGWLSLLAATTATTATTGILMKNVWGNWNPNEKSLINLWVDTEICMKFVGGH